MPRSCADGWLCGTWFILLEDAHQPMHVGDRRDRGGNNLQLQFFRDDYTNLHQVWDSGLLRVRLPQRARTRRRPDRPGSQPEAHDWTRGRIEDWVNESLEAARQAYRIPGSNDLLRSGMRIGREYEEANLPAGREASFPGGNAALGGLERLPFTRGEEGDPRARISAGTSNPLGSSPGPAFRTAVDLQPGLGVPASLSEANSPVVCRRLSVPMLSAIALAAGVRPRGLFVAR